MSYNNLQNTYKDKYVYNLSDIKEDYTENISYITGQFGGVPSSKNFNECPIERIKEDGEGRIVNNCIQDCHKKR